MSRKQAEEIKAMRIELRESPEGLPCYVLPDFRARQDAILWRLLHEAENTLAAAPAEGA